METPLIEKIEKAIETLLKRVKENAHQGDLTATQDAANTIWLLTQSLKLMKEME